MQAHRGDRRSDGSRMMAEVVEHDHSADVALELQASTDAFEGPQAVHDRGGRNAVGDGCTSRPQRIERVVTPDEPKLDGREGAGCIIDPVERQPGSTPGGHAHRGYEARRRAERAGVISREAASPGFDVLFVVDQRREEKPSGPIREAGQELLYPLIVGAGNERRRLPCPIEGPDPALEGRHHVRSRREHVGMIPVGVQQDADGRMIRVEVAAVLVGLDYEDGVPSDSDDRRHAPCEGGRHEGADERRGILPIGEEEVNQPPSRGRLPVRSGHRDQACAPGRRGVGDELLATDRRDAGLASRDELRQVGIDRRQGLRDRDPVDDRAAAWPDDVGRVVSPLERNPRL